MPSRTSHMRQAVPTYDLYGENHEIRPDFWVHCESIPQRSRLHNWEIKPHRHESFFQILHIRKGSAEMMLDGESRPAQPAAMITVPPRVAHGFRFSRDIDGSVITLVVPQISLLLAGHARFLGWYGTPRIIALARDDPDAGFLDDTLARIASELATRAPAGTPLVEAYLASALILAARITAPEITHTPTAGNRDAERIEALNLLIDRNFREHRTADFYAERLGLSATHLNRIARAATGMTVHDMLAQRLIDEAKRDLVFTVLSVQTIAYGLGFNDAGYFTRFFSQKAGMTPRAYRRSQRERLAG